MAHSRVLMCGSCTAFHGILQDCQTRKKLITLLYLVLEHTRKARQGLGQNSEGAWALRWRGDVSSIACGNSADLFVRSRQLMKLCETTGARRKARGSK